MAYCSKKKADLIIEGRPYTSWTDLVSLQLTIYGFMYILRLSVSGAQIASKQKSKRGFAERCPASYFGPGQRTKAYEEVQGSGTADGTLRRIWNRN